MSSAASRPKRVLLDENIDERLRYHLAGQGFEVETVRYAGFQAYKNSKLLRAAEDNFDVLLTLDKSIEFQNNLVGRQIAVLVVRTKSTRLADILPHFDDMVKALKIIGSGQIIYVGRGIKFDEAAGSETR